MGMTLGNDDSLDHVGRHRGRHRLVRRIPLMLKPSSMRDPRGETSLLRVY
jgi:hypothetical protein